MAQPHGALVSSRVMPDSPAELGRPQSGDVILGIQWQTAVELQPAATTDGRYRQGRGRGDPALLRGGKKKVRDHGRRASRTTGKRISTLPAIAQPDDIAQLGLSVIDIEPQVRKELGLDEDGRALVSRYHRVQRRKRA